MVFASLISGMGTTVFAAHSIAVTAETIFYVPGYGLRSAASTLISNARGEGNVQEVKDGGESERRPDHCHDVCKRTYPVCRRFTSHAAVSRPSEAVVTLGAQMLRLVALSETILWPDGGAGRSVFTVWDAPRYAFVVESIGMWGVRIFFTFLVVRVWGLDLRAVWYCMIADNVCKAVLLALPFMSKKIRRRLLEGKND